MDRLGVCLVLICSLAMTTRAHGAVSGAQLSGWCDAWVRVFIEDRGDGYQDVADGASCSAFISGVLEGSSALTGQIYGVGPGSARSPGLGLCYPREAGYPPLIEAVRRYLSEVPRAREGDAAPLVLRAVQEAFPCEGA